MDAIVLDTDVSSHPGWFNAASALSWLAANFGRNAELNLWPNLAGLLRESAVLSRASPC